MAQRVQLTATVSENQLGQRLDQALAEMFPDYSRSRIKEWILDQRVLVNGKVCDKPKEKVLGGEQVAINAEIEEEARFEPQDIPLDIVYEDEDIIIKSPVRRIHKVKSSAKVKETYSDEDLEKLRDNCSNNRDVAMIDLLASTGMRIGELVNLNQNDINFDERECVVLGKGNKQRIVYFDARSKIHLQNYLAKRKDTNSALFVSLHSPYQRMSINGIENRLKSLGKKVGIAKVYPHKFRRTLATNAIDKGMPIEQVQKLLGHERIDTTLHYAMVKQSNVKIAHRRYIG
mgnify:CR=1 FL=1